MRFMREINRLRRKKRKKNEIHTHTHSQRRDMSDIEHIFVSCEAEKHAMWCDARSYSENFAAAAKYSCPAYVRLWPGQVNATHIHDDSRKTMLQFRQRLSDNKFLLPSHLVLFHFFFLLFLLSSLLFTLQSFVPSILPNTHPALCYSLREEVIYIRSYEYEFSLFMTQIELLYSFN